MASDFILTIRDFFVKNIAILILLPLLTFFFVFISYGDALHLILIKNPQFYSLYELNTLNKVISQTTLLPYHVASIAFDMIIYSYLIYALWLLLYAYSSYYKIARDEHNFLLIIIEYLVLVLIYFYVLSPGLSLLIQLAGWFFFLLLIAMFTIYALYFKRVNHEKE